jgi:hypothetical protein
VLQGSTIINNKTEPSDLAAMTGLPGPRNPDKAIRSYEKQIEKHLQKIDDLKNNPTVRPGMERMPRELIEAQQQRRIQKLEREVQTFRDNIEKIKRGKMDH